MFLNHAEMAEIVTLTDAKKEVLNNTTISEQEPGTILRDFQTFLDFVAEAMPLSAKHYMATKILDALNQRMVNPLRHNLRRPLQKSYPYLNGLYLLARSSGLTVVDASGKTPAMKLNEPVHNSWLALNPTERYFMLLETWLLRATSDIIGERSSGIFDSPLLGLQRVISLVPDSGLQAATDENLMEAFAYTPGAFNLALMESFGLVSIQSGEPLEGKGWMIEHVQRTPWSSPLLALIFTLLNNSEILFKYDEPETPPFGELQTLFQPYFSEWKNNLTVPQSEFQEGLFIFKAALSKSVWRRIAIPAADNLDSLSSAILRAYEFGSDHLHEFIYTDQTGAESRAYHSYMDERPWTYEVAIGDLPLHIGASMIYHFDFGDSWKFNVVLEKIDTDNDTIKEPTLLEEHGKAPEQYPSYEGDEW